MKAKSMSMSRVRAREHRNALPRTQEELGRRPARGVAPMTGVSADGRPRGRTTPVFGPTASRNRNRPDAPRSTPKGTRIGSAGCRVAVYVQLEGDTMKLRSIVASALLAAGAIAIPSLGQARIVEFDVTVAPPPPPAGGILTTPEARPGFLYQPGPSSHAPPSFLWPHPPTTPQPAAPS